MTTRPRVRRRHHRLADAVETQVPHLVTHVDTLLDDPDTARTELVLANHTTVPPAVLTAISLAGLDLDVDASGTQGNGGVILVVR